MGLLLVPAARGQQEQSFRAALDAFLARAPMKVSYHYTLTGGGFEQDTTGVMVLVSPRIFRLELWDKVYGSDGSSFYVHDRNTHQTVIDSLRWTEMNLWVRLLNGELPPGTAVAAAGPAREGAARWELSHEEPWWLAVVEVDTLSWSVREMQLYEES